MIIEGRQRKRIKEKVAPVARQAAAGSLSVVDACRMRGRNFRGFDIQGRLGIRYRGGPDLTVGSTTFELAMTL